MPDQLQSCHQSTFMSDILHRNNQVSEGKYYPAKDLMRRYLHPLSQFLSPHRLYARPLGLLPGPVGERRSLQGLCLLLLGLGLKSLKGL